MSPLYTMIQYNNHLVYPPICTVLQLNNGTYVYPIFKNASSSFRDICISKIYNNQISNIETIDIYWRDAQLRFNSAVNTVINEDFKFLDTNTIIHLIESGQLVNRHFMPQYMWLCHLYKYHTGTVRILDIHNLDIASHKNQSNFTGTYKGLKHWIELDNIIHNNFMNKTSSLSDINDHIKQENRILYKKCIAQE